MKQMRLAELVLGDVWLGVGMCSPLAVLSAAL